MSKFDDLVAKYAADLDAIGGHDADLLTKVTKGCGPAIYNADATLFAASDKAEVARLKANFLVKKLGLKDSAKLDDAIASVVKKYDKRQKHRAVVYYLLVKELGQEKHYD